MRIRSPVASVFTMSSFAMSTNARFAPGPARLTAAQVILAGVVDRRGAKAHLFAEARGRTHFARFMSRHLLANGPAQRLWIQAPFSG